ncbi:MAG: ribosome silencing factor [Bacteroidales bacterium]|nr:ribosome silencing factor [Bacteroidales bacterium]
MTRKEQLTESEVLAKLVAQGMENKKATDVEILDLRGLPSAPAAFFVLCSGNVPSHVAAISDSVFEVVKKATGQNPHKVEGYNNAEWILMDYFDVVAHIFLHDKRDFYRLSELWADAKLVTVEPQKAQQ